MPRLSEREAIIRQGRAVQARQLRDAGWSLRAIGRRLGVSRQTILRDLSASGPLVSHLNVVRAGKRDINVTADVIPIRRQA